MPLTALKPAISTLQGSAPALGAPLARSLSLALPLNDSVNGGVFQLIGTTKIKGLPDAPVSRRVRLHDQITGLVVREQWSAAGTGAYAFTRIRAGTFYIAAFDHTRAFNGVLATDVQSEPTP